MDGRKNADMSSSDDRHEIRDLIARYGIYWDSNQHAAFAGLFTVDAEFGFAGRKPAAGRDAIETFSAKIDHGEVHHFTTNETIDIQDGHATSESSFFVTGDKPTTITSTGRYRDELVKVDGRWYFKQRLVTMDQPRGREAKATD